MRRRFWAFLVGGLALVAQAEESVTVKGSDTLLMVMQRWAEQYMAKHPEIEVQITGGGSGTGIAALLNGTTDLAMASRSLTDAERALLDQRTGKPAVEWKVARDGVTFYVNAANPIQALSLEQLKRLYTTKRPRWTAVGGIDHEVALYSRESSSGTYAFVKLRVLNDEDFSVETQTLPGTAAVVTAVAQEPWALGYGGAAFSKGVHELRLRLAGGVEVAPTEANIVSGKYPLTRELYLYARASPSPAARAFVDFVLSPEGQSWLRPLGYFPR